MKPAGRHLARTINHGVTFKPGLQRPPTMDLLQMYLDASFAGNHTYRRSTTSYLLWYHGGPIRWGSLKQKWMAMYTAEAEYIAPEAGRAACILKVWPHERRCLPPEDWQPGPVRHSGEVTWNQTSKFHLPTVPGFAAYDLSPGNSGPTCSLVAVGSRRSKCLPNHCNK